MKKASVAYAEIFDIQLNEHKSLIKEIEKAIDAAIVKGETDTYIKEGIPIPVVTMMRDLYGYTFRKSGRGYNISWDS